MDCQVPVQRRRFDTGAWEYIVHILAEESGISVPKAQAQKFSKTGTTFLGLNANVKRPQSLSLELEAGVPIESIDTLLDSAEHFRLGKVEANAQLERMHAAGFVTEPHPVHAWTTKRGWQTAS